jgi:hypothetical protein
VLRRDDESVAPGIGTTQGVKARRARKTDWDPIRGLHQGQRPVAPRGQAVHMTAPDRADITDRPCAAGAVHT